VLVTRIATAAALVAGLLAALFFLPRNGLAVVVALLLGFGGHEWGRLCRLSSGLALAYAAAVVAVFLVLAYLAVFAPVFSLAALFWIVIVPLWLWSGVARAGSTLLGAAGFLVLVPAGLAMLALRPQEIVLIVALVSIADTTAYFAGRALGRHKLAPSISPGKTWEGAAGALVGVLVYAIIGGLIAEGVAWLPFLAAAALLTALGIVGDLFESAAKRQAGVKDSGAILPGHGGMLDRIDSATATLPVAALLLPLVKSAT
jgi:phosphatidate cytidylyltransferase